MGGAKLLKWRLAAEGAKLLKSGAALILRTPGCHWVTTLTGRIIRHRVIDHPSPGDTKDKDGPGL